MRPHGLQPTRLLRPWDFPGTSTGGGCHCLLRIKCLPCVKGGGWYSENVEGLAGEKERPALPATAFLSAVCFCITWDLVEMLSLAPSDRILISRLHTPTSSQVMLKCCCSTEHSLCGKGAWCISSRGTCKGEGGRKLGSGSPASKSWLHCLCKSGFSRDIEPIGWIDRKIQMFIATSISLCVYVSICAQSHSRVRLFATPWTGDQQAPPSTRILQARIPEWVAMPSSRGIFATQGLSPGLLHCRWILYYLSHQKSPISI